MWFSHPHLYDHFPSGLTQLCHSIIIIFPVPHHHPLLLLGNRTVTKCADYLNTWYCFFFLFSIFVDVKLMLFENLVVLGLHESYVILHSSLLDIEACAWKAVLLILAGKKFLLTIVQYPLNHDNIRILIYFYFFSFREWF